MYLKHYYLMTLRAKHLTINLSWIYKPRLIKVNLSIHRF